MTGYYQSGGIPPWQTGGVATYINGTPSSPDPDANPYYAQPYAPYMTQLHRIELPPPSDSESPMVYRPRRAPATLSLSLFASGSETPTAVASPAPTQRPLEVA